MPDQYILLENRVAGDARVLALVELTTAPPISAYGVSPHRKIISGIFNLRSTLLTRVIGPVLISKIFSTVPCLKTIALYYNACPLGSRHPAPSVFTHIVRGRNFDCPSYLRDFHLSATR